MFWVTFAWTQGVAFKAAQISDLLVTLCLFSIGCAWPARQAEPSLQITTCIQLAHGAM